MADITKKQLKAIISGAPMGSNPRDIVEGLIMKGHNIEGLDPLTTSTFRAEKQQASAISGNQFEQEKPKTFWEKARDFSANIIGGGKLAEGLGQAIAAPSALSALEDASDSLAKTQQDLLQKRKEAVANGQDTSRIDNLLKMNSLEFQKLADASTDFSDSLASNKEVIGSATRLAGLATGGTIFKGASKLAGADKATGVLATGIRTGIAGAGTGAVEGAIQGAGAAAEQDASAQEIALAGGLGAGIGSATGGALGFLGGTGSRLLSNSKALKLQRNQLLQESAKDSRVAQYFKDGSGKIKNDPIATEAVKQGLDEGSVALYKGASQSDKAKMSKMFDILQKGQTDKKFGILNRPEQVVGETALERFKSVVSTNKQAASQLDDVAQRLRGNSIDPTEPVAKFIDDLESLDIKFSNGKIDFRGSAIEGITPAENLITRVVTRMKNVGDDAFELHKLKKFIDEQVEFGKSADGVTGRTENILKGLRRNIDELLDSNFDDYNRVNTQYSETRDALDSFGDVAGRKFNPQSPNVDANAGNLMRRITSNARSRTDVIDAMQGLQSIAEKYGAKFDDDLITQIDFVTELERLYGSAAPTSIKGQIGDPIEEAVKARSSSLLELGLKGLNKVKEGIKDINDEALEKSIRELLK